MDRESTYQLQRVDCNCNDCHFMKRDLSRYELSKQFHNFLDKKVFDKEINTQLFIGYTFRDSTVINKVLKQKFKPQSPIVQFGYCKKFDFKEVSFIPGNCQLETQKCFVHRKDI